jgi:hypothetical protein
MKKLLLASTMLLSLGAPVGAVTFDLSTLNVNGGTSRQPACPCSDPVSGTTIVAMCHHMWNSSTSESGLDWFERQGEWTEEGGGQYTFAGFKKRLDSVFNAKARAAEISHHNASGREVLADEHRCAP